MASWRRPHSPCRPFGVLGRGQFSATTKLFAHRCTSKPAMAAAGVRAWRVPASSPDLNPVEKFWAWLRRRIRIKDCEDLRRRRPPIGKMSLLQSPCARHPRLEGGAARCCSHSCWLSDDLQGGRGQEKGHGQRLAPTHAQCAVSRTGTSVGLSVPKFMLRQEESSSYSCMLLLNTLQTPFPP